MLNLEQTGCLGKSFIAKVSDQTAPALGYKLTGKQDEDLDQGPDQLAGPWAGSG